MKNSDSFHISAKNIDYGYLLESPRQCGSNGYHNPCFWAEIRKLKTQFYYIKVRFMVVKSIQFVFVMK